jgi:hypothetical protein
LTIYTYIIVQEEEGTIVYKMVEQCGDEGQRLERNSTGHSRLEESCDKSQCPPRALVLIISPETPCFDAV